MKTKRSKFSTNTIVKVWENLGIEPVYYSQGDRIYFGQFQSFSIEILFLTKDRYELTISQTFNGEDFHYSCYVQSGLFLLAGLKLLAENAHPDNIIRKFELKSAA